MFSTHIWKLQKLISVTYCILFVIPDHSSIVTQRWTIVFQFCVLLLLWPLLLLFYSDQYYYHVIFKTFRGRIQNKMWKKSYDVAQKRLCCNLCCSLDNAQNEIRRLKSSSLLVDDYESQIRRLKSEVNVLRDEKSLLLTGHATFTICKGTKFLYILSPPTPSFSSPHLHFRPPKPFRFMIFIPPTYFRWSVLYVDFIEEVRSGWRSLSILFIVRDFPFLTITCVPMARIMMYL